MSGSRVVWIIWCLMWAAFWAVMFFVVGRLTDSLAIVTTVLVFASVGAIFLPVGAERTEACPTCGGRFPQQNMPVHMSVRHRVRA